MVNKDLNKVLESIRKGYSVPKSVWRKLSDTNKEDMQLVAKNRGYEINII